MLARALCYEKKIVKNIYNDCYIKKWSCRGDYLNEEKKSHQNQEKNDKKHDEIMDNDSSTTHKCLLLTTNIQKKSSRQEKTQKICHVGIKICMPRNDLKEKQKVLKNKSKSKCTCFVLLLNLILILMNMKVVWGCLSGPVIFFDELHNFLYKYCRSNKTLL